MSGTEVKKLIAVSGLSPNDFCTEAGISIPTYYKFTNDETISDRSRWKIEHAAQRIKAQKHARRLEKAPA